MQDIIDATVNLIYAPQMHKHNEIINRFPSHKALAEELGVTSQAVSAWRRNGISLQRAGDLVKYAKSLRLGIKLEDLF